MSAAATARRHDLPSSAAAARPSSWWTSLARRHLAPALGSDARPLVSSDVPPPPAPLLDRDDDGAADAARQLGAIALQLEALARSASDTLAAQRALLDRLGDRRDAVLVAGGSGDRPPTGEHDARLAAAVADRESAERLSRQLDGAMLALQQRDAQLVRRDATNADAVRHLAGSLAMRLEALLQAQREAHARQGTLVVASLLLSAAALVAVVVLLAARVAGG